jgi:predicted secreted protein
MKVYSYFLITLASIFFIGCCSCKNSIGEVRNLTFNDEKVEARVGDTINISLDYPPTAGFEWKLENNDKEFLALTDNKSHIKIDNSNLYRNIWSFVCIKTGKTTLEFKMKREMNKGKGFNEDLVKSFEIIIKE